MADRGGGGTGEGVGDIGGRGDRRGRAGLWKGEVRPHGHQSPP